MRSVPSVLAPLVLSLQFSAAAQSNAAPPTTRPDPQPIYRVTVVSRTLEAVNYEHRGGPTKIDFQGTVLLPKAKGDATVESKRGAFPSMPDLIIWSRRPNSAQSI